MTSSSVNDIKVDDGIECVLSLGQESMLAKVNVESAQHIVQVISTYTRMLFVTCEKNNNLQWSGRLRMGFMYPSRSILTLSLQC